MTGQRFRLGVDFGTSTTVAMLHRPDGRVLPLLFDGSPLLSSAVLLGLDGRLHTGRDAAHLARSAPERLEPNPKRRIDEVNVLLGDTEVAARDLVVAVLSRVTAEATRVAGPVRDIVLTHPANWGSGRRALLAEAARQVGYTGIELVGEPLAAAMYLGHARGGDLPVGACVLVYDLGAGTCDVTLLRRQPSGFHPVASDGLNDVGGLDVDAAVIAFLQATYGELWTSAAARRQLWDDVRSAKEMLSRASGTVVMVPALAKEVPLGREQLEGLARPVLRPTVAMTRALLQQSGVPASAVAGLFLVGGSSRIPLVATLLHEALGIAPVVAEQPELVVAEGSLYATAPPAAPPTQAFPATGSFPPSGAFPAAGPVTGSFAPSSGPPFAPSSGPPFAPSSAPPFAPSAGPSSGPPFAPPVSSSPVSPSAPYSPSSQISATPGAGSLGGPVVGGPVVGGPVVGGPVVGGPFPGPPAPPTAFPGRPAPRPPTKPSPRGRRSPALTGLVVLAVLAVLAGGAFAAVKLLDDNQAGPGGGASPTAAGGQPTRVAGGAGKYVMSKLPGNLCELADIGTFATLYPTATGDPTTQRQLTTVVGFSTCALVRTRTDQGASAFQSVTISFNEQVYADLTTARSTFQSMQDNAKLNYEVTAVSGLGEQAFIHEQSNGSEADKRTLMLVLTARDNNLLWTTNVILSRSEPTGWTAAEKTDLRNKTIESTKSTFKNAQAALSA